MKCPGVEGLEVMSKEELVEKITTIVLEGDYEEFANEWLWENRYEEKASEERKAILGCDTHELIKIILGGMSADIYKKFSANMLKGKSTEELADILMCLFHSEVVGVYDFRCFTQSTVNCKDLFLGLVHKATLEELQDILEKLKDNEKSTVKLE